LPGLHLSIFAYIIQINIRKSGKSVGSIKCIHEKNTSK
jgi:hypothetical protein